MVWYSLWFDTVYILVRAMVWYIWLVIWYGLSVYGLVRFMVLYDLSVYGLICFMVLYDLWFGTVLVWFVICYGFWLKTM